MDIDRWLEREEDNLDKELQEGIIDQREYNRRYRDLQQEARESIKEEAQQAYDNIMGRY